MQFKVPQNIDMQDKIIGPLTLSQFFYLLFGGLVVYILFNKLVLNGLSFLFFILAAPIAVFSIAMAFFKVQDRPFPSFFMAFVTYLRQPRARVWQHYRAPTKSKVAPTETKKTEVTKKEFDTVRVNELATLLDSHSVREGNEDNASVREDNAK